MKDQFGREINYLRLSVTDRCNLRCRYCMPEEGVCKKPHTEMLTEDEMIDAVEAAAALGVTKLRITGGEPLVKRNIVALCARAAHVPGIRELCITTNGVLLPKLAKGLRAAGAGGEPLVKRNIVALCARAAHVPGIRELCITTNGVLLPKLAKGLRAAGVNRVNLSLDTLDPKKYAHITRVGTLEGALDGLHAALEAGFDKVKINAVLIGGFNDDEIEPLANLTMRYPVDVRFIELMPMLDHPEFGEAAFIPYTRVLDKLPQAQGISPDGGVAKLYRLPGALGNIGLISPVSAHFCAECNRIRLTADGKLKPCLHAADEVSLKGMTREQMRETMSRVMYEKPSCHAELSATQHSHAGRSMNQIGG